MDLDIVSLSRLQFAITALYHFLFVPLTIGLSLLVLEARDRVGGRAHTVPTRDPQGAMHGLDLGCGWGPITLALAEAAPDVVEKAAAA